MRLRGTLVSLALLAGLAGCGGGDEPSIPSPGAGSGPTATSGPSDASAEQVLADGLRALLTAPAVDFRYRTLSGTTVLTETSGRAFLDGGWSATTTFDDAATGVVAPQDDDQDDDQDDEQGSGADYTMSVRATDDDVFMQLSSWPEPAAGCWLQMGPGEAPVGLLAMTPKLPFYIGLLGTLHAVGFEDGDDSVVVARTQLRSALLLLSGPVAQSLTLTAEQARSARVPVGVFTQAGVVTDVALRGSDIVESVQKAGGTVPAETAAGLAQLDLTIRYQRSPSDAKPVAAPAAGLVMTSADLAGHGCTAEN
jgi:hypothetical protein